MHVELAVSPLAPGRRLDAFTRSCPGSGAVVSFSGVARPENGEVLALELQAYAGFTEAEIRRVAEGAKSRFELEDLLILHRIGRISPGEAIVFVATAARHRRAAFEGADFLMDYLKSRAPFWKKSHERGGSRWILPRPEDYQDAARWTQEETPR